MMFASFCKGMTVAGTKVPESSLVIQGVIQGEQPVIVLTILLLLRIFSAFP